MWVNQIVGNGVCNQDFFLVAGVDAGSWVRGDDATRIIIILKKICNEAAIDSNLH